MFGLPELDGDLEGRHREHAAPLHSRRRRGTRRLITAETSSGPARPRILAFDTAGSACSVAVAAAECVLSLHCRTMVHGQAEALLPMVDAAMREAALTVEALDLVAVTVGPGSFTGIRVGLAAAQGIAFATTLPLFGITGFEAVAVCAGREAEGDDPVLLVALESRRAELYVQVFDGDHPLAEPVALAPAALPDWTLAVCGRRRLVVAGDAAARAAAALAGRAQTMVAAPPAAVAVGVAGAALGRWRRGERRGRTEPLYLRPPDVTRPVAAGPPLRDRGH